MNFPEITDIKPGRIIEKKIRGVYNEFCRSLGKISRFRIESNIMALITLDIEKCTGCGSCVHVCPNLIFYEKSGRIAPKIAPYSEERCIVCGHCVASCPVSAITVGDVSPENSPQLDKEKLPGFEQCMTLAQTRRSIRRYQRKPVSQEHLDKVFEILRWAPTAKNRLLLDWIVVNRRETVHELAGIIVDGLRDDPEYKDLVAVWDNGYDWVLRGAPCLLISCSNRENLWLAYDSGIAVETIDLVLPSLGLGGCWAGFFMHFAETNPVLRERLQIPDNVQVGATLMLGYPDREVYRRAPWRPEISVRFVE